MEGSTGHRPTRGLLASLGSTYLLLSHGGNDCPHVVAAGKFKGRHHLGPDALLE